MILHERALEESKLVPQLDGRNFCPAALQGSCKSRRGNTVEPDGDINLNIRAAVYMVLSLASRLCERYLVQRQGDLSFLVTLHQLCVFCSDMDFFGGFFNLL